MSELPSWHLEILELHAFFQAWNNGTVPNTETSLARVTQVWKSDFSLIFPKGQRCGREEILEQLNLDYHCDTIFRIEIKNVKLRWSTEHLVLAFYEEWHTDEKEIEGRSCSALFEKDVNTPNGWRWLHIHESPLYYLAKQT